MGSQLSKLNSTGSFDSPLKTMKESIKNREYLLELEAKFDKPSDSE
jgi:hypothetical protein